MRPIEADMGMEVVCPPVVTPGEFFLCTADIPQGSDLTFSLVMTDDLQPSMTTDSGTLVAPEQFLHIPGGPLKTAAYNLTLEPDDMTAKTYIIQSTYFQYMSNLSGIYYVPAAEGDILFEVRIIFKFSRDENQMFKTHPFQLVTPNCPLRKALDGSLVQTYWCPISKSCEEFCFSFLESQDPK